MLKTLLSLCCILAFALIGLAWGWLSYCGMGAIVHAGFNPSHQQSIPDQILALFGLTCVVFVPLEPLAAFIAPFFGHRLPNLAISGALEGALLGALATFVVYMARPHFGQAQSSRGSAGYHSC
jgi:hypothetical protein